MILNKRWLYVFAIVVGLGLAGCDGDDAGVQTAGDDAGVQTALVNEPLRSADLDECPTGEGVKIPFGVDDDGDGVLEPEDEDPDSPKIVCDGVQGPQGPEGPE